MRQPSQHLAVMLRLGGPMRAGGTRGTMEQCLAELEQSCVPYDFKLAQVRSLVRYMREVAGLQKRIEDDSGFKADTASYLEILCAKEESDLMRRVSSVRCLKQDFDEKRLEWRKHKKNVINAIGSMTSRALRFEDKERKTIALHALAFYKNVMATDDGAIPGESESTDGLIEQYKRHRTEISKIPTFTDSILKMLKDIRKTVRSSAKLQPGSNAFAQFLDEWWASVVQFLQQSSIVDAEKNAREVMETLKQLKIKQEENKKREISRLLSKLDDNAGMAPPTGRLSDLFDPPASLDLSDSSPTPEDTSAGIDCGSLDLSSRSEPAQHQGLKRDRHSHSSEESQLSTVPAAVVVGDEDDDDDDGGDSPAIFGQTSTNHDRRRQQQQKQKQHQQQQLRVSFADSWGNSQASASSSKGLGGRSNSASRSSRCAARGNTSTQEGVGEGQRDEGSSRRDRPLSTSLVNRGEVVGRHTVGSGAHVIPHRPSQGSALRSPPMPMMAGIGGTAFSTSNSSRDVNWEEGSQGTAGTTDTTDMRQGVSASGIPDSDDEEDGEEEDDDEEELFEAADNLDLGAVDLCATEAGADGQMTYRDQDEMRMPVKASGPQLKQGVEQKRFSAALDFFRQEQQKKIRHPVLGIHPPSPMRSSASFATLPSKSPRITSTGSTNSPFAQKMGGGMRVRTPGSRSRGEAMAMAKAATRRRGSSDKDTMTAKSKLLMLDNSKNRGRSLSVYVPSSRSQATPTHRASKTPTVRSSRRPLVSPSVKKYSRAAFFG